MYRYFSGAKEYAKSNALQPPVLTPLTSSLVCLDMLTRYNGCHIHLTRENLVVCIVLRHQKSIGVWPPLATTNEPLPQHVCKYVSM